MRIYKKRESQEETLTINRKELEYRFINKNPSIGEIMFDSVLLFYRDASGNHINTLDTKLNRLKEGDYVLCYLHEYNHLYHIDEKFIDQNNNTIFISYNKSNIARDVFIG